MTDLERIITYFKEISHIPRSSGDEKAISDYLVAFAEKHHLEVIRDDVNNVIIKKPAYPGEEHRSPLILQGHVDMVYVKREGSDHRYENGIEVLDDGEFLRARDTTLGADNGIAVCYALMLLESDDIKHPPLECIFTVDEEVGMKGAENIDLSMLKGKGLINLDSEEEGIFCVGCAGGLRSEFYLPIEREEKSGEFVPVEFWISGLKGGHSGSDIQLERGNAIKLFGRALYHVKDIAFDLGMVDGSGKSNVIAQTVKSVCYMDKSDVENFVTQLREIEKVFQNELKFSDTVNFHITVGEAVENCVVYSQKTKENLMNLLVMFPYGVIRWSMGVKGLVQTSTNPGSMTEKDGKIEILSLIRSSVESEKSIVSDQLNVLADMFGGESRFSSDYPGWEYKKDSKLRDMVIEKYEALSGKKAVIEAIHAGLEGGYWDGKMENIDIISMGPDIMDAHTVNERASKQSAVNVWELLKEVVEAY